MLRAFAAGVLAGLVLALGVVAAAQEGPSLSDVVRAVEATNEANERVLAERAKEIEAAREAVEAHRKRLQEEIADLTSILRAQVALVRYAEIGGGGDEEGLDPRLCRESALRPLCPSLEETFGELGQ